MSKKLLKSGILVSGLTLVSRVLGLIRDMIVASVLGAGAMSDVFLFANRIPNFLRRLFAEGAFSKAFVPVLAEYNSDNDLNKSVGVVGIGSVCRDIIGNDWLACCSCTFRYRLVYGLA